MRPIVRRWDRDSSVVDVAGPVSGRPPSDRTGRFESLSQNLRVPVNRLISQCASQAMFIVWVILTQVRRAISTACNYVPSHRILEEQLLVCSSLS